MELENIILHQIIREKNNDPELNLSSQLLKIDDISKGFIEKLTKSYTSKNPTYGKFDADDKNNIFQVEVKQYFETNDFLKFSTEAMSILKKAIRQPQAKGGYVVFAHYIEKKQDFLVTVMLDNSERFVVNENLNIERLLGLDIDKVARANRINWQEWHNNKETYLSFIKGTRGVSNYFAKDFIGCNDYTSSKENAKNLELAVSQYMGDNNFDDDKKINIKGKIKQYTDNQIDAKKEINIDSISALIDEENISSFANFIQETERKVGNFISTRKSDFKFFEKKILIGDDYKLEYNLNSENIYLDEKQQIIVIKNVSESIFKD